MKIKVCCFFSTSEMEHVPSQLSNHERETPEAPGVHKICPPNMLMQHNPDMVVIDVHSVFLARIRTNTQRGCVFGQKQGIQLA